MFLHTYARITRALRTHVKPLLVALMTVTISVPVLVWAGSTNEEDVLTMFYPGDKIKAEDVNGNFATLQSELEALRATLQTTVPVGTVIAYAGETEPQGWLLCDGRALDRNMYNVLFSVIGESYGYPSETSFYIPDYRGRFLRGVDGGTGRDPDVDKRTAMSEHGHDGDLVGSVQADSFQGHFHQLGHPDRLSKPGYVIGWDDSNDTPYSQGLGTWEFTSQQITSAITIFQDSLGNGLPRIGRETRPQNVYVNYLIKY